MLARTQWSPIGLDIGTRTIKAVQLAGGAHNRRVARAALLARATPGAPIDSAEIDRLAAVLSRQDFRGAQVVVAMPADRVISALLDLPPATSGAPLGMIARQELARNARCEPNAIEHTWWTLPGSNRIGGSGTAQAPTQALGVACRHADAESLLDTFESAGFEVNALEPSVTALVRAAAPQLGDDTQTSAIIDIGGAASTVILTRGRVPVYQRTMMDAGMTGAIAALIKKTGHDAATAEAALVRAPRAAANAAGRRSADDQAVLQPMIDALCDELRLASAYLQRRFESPLHGVMLAGGGAALPVVAGALADRAGAPVRSLGLHEAYPCAEGIDASVRGPLTLQALGLALHPLHHSSEAHA